MNKVSLATAFLCLLLTNEVKAELQPALWDADTVERLESSGLGLSDLLPIPN